eukprot:s2999_g8.t1
MPSLLFCYTTLRSSRMDLEGVSRDDLLEAAAELQLRQTAALQGEAFMGPRPATLFSNPREVKDASNLGSEGLVPKLAQLLLRQEDYLNGLAQSTTWVMFQGTAPALSTIPAQATISEQWQITKVEQPASIRHPLRTVLFQTWASELKKQYDWKPSQSQTRSITWNPTLRALESVSNIAPLTTQEVVRLLEEVIVLSTEESALINYHPTKKLLPEMTGPTVTFSLVLGLRDPQSLPALDSDRNPVGQRGADASGTAAFYALLYRCGKQPEGFPRDFYIGKDVAHASDELDFYARLREAVKEGGSWAAFGRMAMACPGIVRLECVGAKTHLRTKRLLLLLENLRHGFERMRLLDVKLGAETSVAGCGGLPPRGHGSTPTVSREEDLGGAPSQEHGHCQVHFTEGHSSFHLAKAPGS